MRIPEFRFYYFTQKYEESVAFYRDLLGFAIYHSWDRPDDRGTIFRAPNSSGLIEIESGPPASEIRAGLYIEVPNVDEWFDRACRSGVPITKELGNTDYGHRHFKTMDPSGLEISFFSYITIPPHVGEPLI